MLPVVLWLDLKGRFDTVTFEMMELIIFFNHFLIILNQDTERED